MASMRQVVEVDGMKVLATVSTGGSLSDDALGDDNPLNLGEASPGVSDKAARQDHVHNRQVIDDIPGLRAILTELQGTGGGGGGGVGDVPLGGGLSRGHSISSLKVSSLSQSRMGRWQLRWVHRMRGSTTICSS